MCYAAKEGRLELLEQCLEKGYDASYRKCISGYVFSLSYALRSELLYHLGVCGESHRVYSAAAPGTKSGPGG